MSWTENSQAPQKDHKCSWLMLYHFPHYISRKYIKKLYVSVRDNFNLIYLRKSISVVMARDRPRKFNFGLWVGVVGVSLFKKIWGRGKFIK